MDPQPPVPMTLGQQDALDALFKAKAALLVAIRSDGTVGGWADGVRAAQRTYERQRNAWLEACGFGFAQVA
jgi:hypothetical protein